MSKMFDLAAIPPGTIENVSRRFVLKGFVASGALVGDHDRRPQRFRLEHRQRLALVPEGGQHQRARRPHRLAHIGGGAPA